MDRCRRSVTDPGNNNSTAGRHHLIETIRPPRNQLNSAFFQTIARHGLHKNARPCLHCVTRGLLQCHSHSRITKIHDRQVTTLLVHISSITVGHDSCTTICTGLTFLDVSNTKLTSQCTVDCRVRRSSTWTTVALQSQTLLADATYARPFTEILTSVVITSINGEATLTHLCFCLRANKVTKTVVDGFRRTFLNGHPE